MTSSIGGSWVLATTITIKLFITATLKQASYHQHKLKRTDVQPGSGSVLP
jgi:hypothetical protein